MKNFATTLIASLCLMGTAQAQDTSQNYVMKRTMLNTEASSYIENIQYYDGLGRPFQSVERAVKPNTQTGSILATLQEYDASGRESNTWLPIAITGSYLAPGTFKSNASSNYGGDTRPYSQRVYESSPLDRLTESYRPGNEWSNKPAKVEYAVNTTDSPYNCIRYSVSSADAPVNNGNYAKGTLRVTKAADEDRKAVYTFTDKQGQILLERRTDSLEVLDTYYVYDDYGCLRFVLQPEYQTTANLDLFAFQYKYDDHNNCIWKKLPGVQYVTYEYDSADRLIFSQDGNQRASGKWTFYVYDSLSRLTQQGENTGKAVADSKVYLQNYYDNYTSLRSAVGSNSNYPNDTSGNSRGFLTGTMTKVLGTDTKLYTAFYYDIEGHVTKKVQQNLLGGHDITTTTYSFSGKPLTVTHEHKDDNDNILLEEVYTYTYDEKDRVSMVKHKLGSTEVTLASYTYDTFGRIATKKLHGSSTNQLTYSYNIQNWLTGISSAKFTQNLTYNNAGSGYYNGNISRMDWKAGDVPHYYTFTYDGVNRMLDATHGAGLYTEKVTSYDKNGNIKGLQRYGNGLIDNLTYTYSGNQLTRVDDATGNSAGFSNGASTANEYTYDNNGNLTKDSNKNISSITYNCLNLPSKVTFSDGSTITYSYAADGTKLRTVHTISGTVTQKDYCANVVYENGIQKILLTEEGYVNLSDGKYYYYLKDHQGNNRVVVKEDGEVKETNHYYPFGGVFASTGNVQPYKYNGKELDTKKGLNWYDYGARHYDAALGRWFAVDPLAEKMYGWGPYTYCFNNPVLLVDPKGKEGIRYTDENGNKIVESNIVVLQKAPKSIPANATAKQIARIQKKEPKDSKQECR